MCTAEGRVIGSVAEALRMAHAAMDYLNSPAADLDPAACGPVLTSLGGVQAKFTAAHASVLARFDAAAAHDGDGYGTSAAWLMAMTDVTRPDARVTVRRMRLLRDHPALAGASRMGASPNRGQWRSLNGPGSCPRSCARRRSRSWWRPPGLGPPRMTCGS